MASTLFNDVVKEIKEARESVKNYLDTVPDTVVKYLADQGGIVLYNAVYNNSHCIFRTGWLDYLAMPDHGCYADAVGLAQYFCELRDHHEPCFCGSNYKCFNRIEDIGSRLGRLRKIISDRQDALRKEHGYLLNVGTEACRIAYWQIVGRDADLNNAKAEVGELYKDFFNPVYRVLIGEAVQERLEGIK